MTKVQSIFLLEDDELWLNRDETGVFKRLSLESANEKGVRGVVGNHLTRKRK
jgi:hypothetical protein